MNEQPTVVYADILGFSDLVMAMPGAIGFLDGFHYANMSPAQLRRSFAEEPTPDSLTRTFAAFHRALDIRISELLNAAPLAVHRLLRFSFRRFSRPEHHALLCASLHA